MQRRDTLADISEKGVCNSSLKILQIKEIEKENFRNQNKVSHDCIEIHEGMDAIKEDGIPTRQGENGPKT